MPWQKYRLVCNTNYEPPMPKCIKTYQHILPNSLLAKQHISKNGMVCLLVKDARRVTSVMCSLFTLSCHPTLDADVRCRITYAIDICI